ncbi:Uncharacterised protein [Vibrio cholerae]|nr:Uncharacterised protein [Vibrio cholerae]
MYWRSFYQLISYLFTSCHPFAPDIVHSRPIKTIGRKAR